MENERPLKRNKVVKAKKSSNKQNKIVDDGSLPPLPEDCIFEIGKHFIMQLRWKSLLGWCTWRLVSKRMQERMDLFYLKNVGVRCYSPGNFVHIAHLCTEFCIDSEGWDMEKIFSLLKDSRVLTILYLAVGDLKDYVGDIAEIIRNNRSIVDLTFFGTDLGKAELGPAFAQNKTITKLSLKLDDSERSTMNSIMSGLENNDRLTYLNVEDCDLDENVEYLIKVPLTALYLSYSRIGTTGFEHLGELMSFNRLVYLDLSNTNSVGLNCKAFIECLYPRNSSLTHLNINSCNIGSEEIRQICRGLNNKNLTYLDVSYNEIRDEGVGSIVNLASNIGSLTFLNLSSNGIGNEGAKIIAESLEVNSSFIELIISRNQIEDSGVKLITSALVANKSLTYLNISNNRISEEGDQFIESVVNAKNSRFLRIEYSKTFE